MANTQKARNINEKYFFIASCIPHFGAIFRKVVILIFCIFWFSQIFIEHVQKFHVKMFLNNQNILMFSTKKEKLIFYLVHFIHAEMSFLTYANMYFMVCNRPHFAFACTFLVHKSWKPLEILKI